MNQSDHPVVIVGAGPVGLAAGIGLARRGVRCLILERHPQPYPLPRAVHLDDEVWRILQQIGVATQFAGISRPGAGLRLLDARHRVIARFRRESSDGVHGYPPSNLFDQPDLEHVLRAELARQPHAELRSGIEVTGLEWNANTGVGQSTSAPVLVRVRDGSGTVLPPVRAPFVLGCDGAESIVRRFIGAQWENLGFEQRWLVIDVRCRLPLRVWDGVDQICDPRRAATAIRIGPHRYRWEFRLHPGETVAELTAPSRLAQLLAPWTGQTPATELQIVRAAEYTFRAALADRWRCGPVFLLGDAAHLTPPFIGQGLGSGLRDVHNLVWKLELALRTDNPELLLQSYQSERRPHARALIRLAVTAGWAMTGGQDRAATIRRVLLAGFCRLPGATSLVLDRPGPALTPGPWVHSQFVNARGSVGRFRNPAGSLVPQPWVRTSTGRHRLDDVLGPGFALLSLESLDPPDPDLLRLAERFDATLITVREPGPKPATGSDLTPSLARVKGSGARLAVESTSLSTWLRTCGAGAVLLRPDRVVLAAAPRRRSWIRHPRAGHIERHCP